MCERNKFERVAPVLSAYISARYLEWEQDSGEDLPESGSDATLMRRAVPTGKPPRGIVLIDAQHPIVTVRCDIECASCLRDELKRPDSTIRFRAITIIKGMCKRDFTPEEDFLAFVLATARFDPAFFYHAKHINTYGIRSGSHPQSELLSCRSIGHRAPVLSMISKAFTALRMYPHSRRPGYLSSHTPNTSRFELVVSALQGNGGITVMRDQAYDYGSDVGLISPLPRLMTRIRDDWRMGLRHRPQPNFLSIAQYVDPIHEHKMCCFGYTMDMLVDWHIEFTYAIHQCSQQWFELLTAAPHRYFGFITDLVLPLHKSLRLPHQM
jgi:hypothetical protein